MPKGTFLPMLGLLIVMGMIGYLVEARLGLEFAKTLLQWVLIPLFGVIVALAALAQFSPAFLRKSHLARVLRLFENDNTVGIALGASVLGAMAFSVGARIVWEPY